MEVGGVRMLKRDKREVVLITLRTKIMTNVV